VELPSPPASVYSLSSTPSGSLLAAGTPERVVRVWDPRSRRQVARLGGHTDNVRGVLLGEEGKWVSALYTAPQVVRLTHLFPCSFYQLLRTQLSSCGRSRHKNACILSRITRLLFGLSFRNIPIWRSFTLAIETAMFARSTWRAQVIRPMASVSCLHAMGPRTEIAPQAGKVSLSSWRKTIATFGPPEAAVASNDGKTWRRGADEQGLSPLARRKNAAPTSGTRTTPPARLRPNHCQSQNHLRSLVLNQRDLMLLRYPSSRVLQRI
jgi:WD40 repeat protein